MYKGSTSAGAWLQRKVVVEDLRKTGKATEEVNVSRKNSVFCWWCFVFCREVKREKVSLDWVWQYWLSLSQPSIHSAISRGLKGMGFEEVETGGAKESRIGGLKAGQRIKSLTVTLVVKEVEVNSMARIWGGML